MRMTVDLKIPQNTQQTQTTQITQKNKAMRTCAILMCLDDNKLTRLQVCLACLSLNSMFGVMSSCNITTESKSGKKKM